MTAKRSGQVETDVYGGFVRRILRAYGRRVGAGDVAALPELVALRKELDATIADAVAQLRAEPWSYSWAQVGEALGMSRQQAQRDYGPKTGPGARRAGGQPSSLR